MADELKVEYLSLSEIIPYERNPRRNDKAVSIVAKSIKEFGFKNPILVDKNNVIVAGHTRLKAAQKLGLQKVPVVWARDLSPEQIKAFRIMDNRSHEYSGWDWDLLMKELHDLKDMNYDAELTGFDSSDIDDVDKYFASGLKEIDENIETENQCPKCGYKW